jgi:type II secretory pathway pseudopilin PulG
MWMNARKSHAFGFSLIETLLVIVVLAVLVALLASAFSGVRRASRASVCLSNLRQFGVASGAYAFDFDDRIFGFTWRAGHTGSVYSDLRNLTSDNSAAAAQAIEILRSRGDRRDLPASLIHGWIPHVLYTHLVIQDYLTQRIPEKNAACPGDVDLLNWQRDPQQSFDLGMWLPRQPDPTVEGNKRWPYGSSYQVVPASYDNGAPGSRIHQQGMLHYQYLVPASASLGDRRLAEVRFPGGKVFMQDSEDRLRSRSRLYYANPNATVSVLMFDGSVDARKTRDADEGWDPNRPNSKRPTQMVYRPRAWEAQLEPGQTEALYLGYYRWTRKGLQGADFGASAVSPRP